MFQVESLKPLPCLRFRSFSLGERSRHGTGHGKSKSKSKSVSKKGTYKYTSFKGFYDWLVPQLELDWFFALTGRPSRSRRQLTWNQKTFWDVRKNDLLPI